MQNRFRWPIYGGTFTLAYDGQTTAPISHPATAAEVQAAFEALTNVQPGDITVDKPIDDMGQQEWELFNVSQNPPAWCRASDILRAAGGFVPASCFGDNLAGKNVPQTTINVSGLQPPGTATDYESTDIQGGVATKVDERQRVALSNAAGGTFRLAFKGYATAPIVYNAPSSVVESALEALPSIDDVTVTGNAGGPWTVTFVGAHSGKNEPELEGDASGATIGTRAGAGDDARACRDGGNGGVCHAIRFGTDHADDGPGRDGDLRLRSDEPAHLGRLFGPEPYR